MQRARDFVQTHWVILLVLLVAACVRFAVISRPFIGNQEGTVAGIPLCVARNYARYGPTESRFAGVLNSGNVLSRWWAIYSHHPPLVPLLVAAVYRIAGVTEFTSRLTSACFALANTTILYVLGRRYFDVRVGVLAAIFYAFCPATLAFGDMADYVNVQLVFFMLLCVAFYAHWRETGRRGDLIALAIYFFLGALTDWPIFYLVPLLGLHLLIADGPRRGVLRFLPFALLALLLLCLLGWWMTWSGGDVSILHQLRVRVAGKLDDRVPITLGLWLGYVVHRNMGVLHTYPVLLLAFVYVGGCVYRRRWRERSHLVPLLLLGIAAIHSIVAVQANVQHMFWSVLFTPGLCLAAAMACSWLMVRWFVALPLLIAFVAISAPAAHRLWTQEYKHLRGLPYSQKQLGSLIHTIARDDEGVMISEVNLEPELWFYADRQLLPAVTTTSAFDVAMATPYYLLPFKYTQPGGPTPRWFVMPRNDRPTYPELTATLDGRFNKKSFDLFDVYDLTSHAH